MSIKKEIKKGAVNYAKDEIRDAAEDQVVSFLPWYVQFFWWPIKGLFLLITWPIRILIKKR
ncbi:MAG: hypothetical protein KA521_00690 [Crocinitomicaceae bacterium]|nr:hypothetical protein [Crocinitomicaceae bacterium]